ncbi:hypothetical protein EGI26_12575 [Lacihabitans sp. CCS-44]|nr:hypothetical protein [Lacihabitans sp. CCS-44]
MISIGSVIDSRNRLRKQNYINLILFTIDIMPKYGTFSVYKIYCYGMINLENVFRAKSILFVILEILASD